MESVAFMISLSDYGLDVRSFLKIEKVCQIRNSFVLKNIVPLE